MSLAERVKQLRAERGWSQGELAERIGGDPAQISRYCSSTPLPAGPSVPPRTCSGIASPPSPS
jgi:transcriptional regulator with XRE-family HTH domain